MYNTIENGIVRPRLCLTVILLLIFEEGIEVDVLVGIRLPHSLVDDILPLGHSGLVLSLFDRKSGFDVCNHFLLHPLPNEVLQQTLIDDIVFTL